MDSLISPNQNAFIKGCLIVNNIFLASELMSFIHHAKCKSQWGALKVDMAKAYDRLSWNFLEAVLRCMDFPEHFITLIMNCVSSVSYSLLLNGHITGRILATRGLRQGDPFSPYLFILCMNVLSCLFSDAKKTKLIESIQFARRGPRISHLMYVDDLVVFFESSVESARFLKSTLDSFCNAAGLTINKQESILVLSPNTSRHFKKFISAVFGVTTSNKLGKHLGVFIDNQ